MKGSVEGQTRMRVDSGSVSVRKVEYKALLGGGGCTATTVPDMSVRRGVWLKESVSLRLH